jgi:hypothetical protein
MMKRVLACVLLVLVACPAFAKPKEKIYQATCDRVWAAVKIATAPPHYNFAQLDDAQKKGMVSTGNNFSGKRYNDKGDLFKRIDDALAQDSTPAPATPTAAPAPKN